MGAFAAYGTVNSASTAGGRSDWDICRAAQCLKLADRYRIERGQTALHPRGRGAPYDTDSALSARTNVSSSATDVYTCGVTRTPCTPALSYPTVHTLCFSSSSLARSSGGMPAMPTLAMAHERRGSVGVFNTMRGRPRTCLTQYC